jgi:hypothetical protein
MPVPDSEATAIRRRVRARLGQQRALVRALLDARAQLTGSVFARYGRCGKAGCACRRGRGHGPYYVLSRRHDGRGDFAYLGAGQLAQARALVSRARAFRADLRRLQQLNISVVALLRDYQTALTRRGARRLGLAAREG